MARCWAAEKEGEHETWKRKSWIWRSLKKYSKAKSKFCKEIDKGQEESELEKDEKGSHNSHKLFILTALTLIQSMDTCPFIIPGHRVGTGILGTGDVLPEG